MSRKTKVTSAVCMTAMFASVIGAQASGANAREVVQGTLAPSESPLVAAPPLNVIVTHAADIGAAAVEAVTQPAEAKSERSSASSLADLVASLSTDTTLSRELHCLASAIYFEARGEPLIGQLAVGSVVVNRAVSGRFPASYCGVVHQRAQFSFVRGGRMPSINQESAAWKRAKALATIADEGLWESPAPDALFFHASYVKPRWKLQRIAQVSTHVFYR